MLVAGSRSFEDCYLDSVFDVLSQASYCLDMTFDQIIHGGAHGVDRMAGKWAFNRGYPVVVYEPDWDGLGRRAGYVRNAEMVADCDAAIVLWDGSSRGTKHTIDLLMKGLDPFVVVLRDPGSLT